MWPVYDDVYDDYYVVRMEIASFALFEVYSPATGLNNGISL